MRDQGILSISAWFSPGHPDEPALRATGFVEVGTQQVNFGAPEFGVRAASAILGDPATRHHITMSDFDFF